MILRAVAELASLPGPLFLAIGVFDGVHLGHRAVITRALADAHSASGTAVLVTFDPHPLRVLRPEVAPHLLTSTAHKIQLIQQMGLEHLLILSFTPVFAATPPENFITALATAARPLREICVGHQWSFGRNRAGNLEMLDRLGNALGFDEVGVPAVELEGEIVSSTRIRQAVQRGDLPLASRLLGRPFSLLGTVIEGDKIGRQLGFPTANLSTHSEQFPPDGVYTARAVIAGKLRAGIVNIGTRPTRYARTGERLVELHLLDFSGDLYGQEIEVEFGEYLRPEQTFANLEALQTQIARDIHRARELPGS